MPLPKSCDEIAIGGFRADTVSVAKIKAGVCAEFDLPMIEMVSQRRGRRVARPRQIAMYLSRELTPYSFPNIGHFFGDRDHTTIMHGVATVERLMQECGAFRSQVEGIKSKLVQELKSYCVDNAHFDAFAEISASA